MPSFRAKARAIDLLGKGQIADLPTAISELWKNGYDAYADNLACNLYMNHPESAAPIFTLSDDGKGMSEQDILEKWIVLGTDSKIRSNVVIPEDERLGKPPRVAMGEKGIGRLSVAYLGSLMVMITKKKNKNPIMVFVDWSILENFNLYIDEVSIPIKEFTIEENINLTLQQLIRNFKENLNQGDWSEHITLKDSISKKLDMVNIPPYLKEDISFFFKENDHGTIFLIFDIHYALPELLKRDSEYKKLIVSSLSGIYNNFSGNQEFSTEFNIISPDSRYNILNFESFFTNDDLSKMEHRITGSFDETGLFTGTVRAFNKVQENIIFRANQPLEDRGYGSFFIDIALNEGKKSDSNLSDEEFAYFNKKFDFFSGLYIYRDDFRVLPYGRTDYDFLAFEERRSKHAGKGFFSHRRMFGYINISKSKNSKLVDKSGREGFITNRAYSNFRSDLVDFFIDIAERFFATNDKKPVLNLRTEGLRDIRIKNALNLEEENKKKELAEFRKMVNSSIKIIPDIQKSILKIESEINCLKNANNIQNNQIEQINQDINVLKNKINQINYDRPNRYELPLDTENNYLKLKIDLENVLNKLLNNENELINITKKVNSSDYMAISKNRVILLHNDILKIIKIYQDRIISIFKNKEEQAMSDLNVLKSKYLNKIKLFLDEKNNHNDIILWSRELHQEFDEEINQRYKYFIEHIENIQIEMNDSDLIYWYKKEYNDIKKRADAMHELAQLGMAIEIIDHQFNVLYAEISLSIKYFKKFTENNSDAKRYYQQLQNSFQHLETNHQLLVPLYRTTRRTRTKISGLAIKNYINRFFERVFIDENINFSTDESFDTYEFFTFESIINPVFINLINNAVYWLTSSETKKIHLTHRDGKVYILDSGRGIEPAYLERIFDLFFTRRPGGRGIGLYLARTNLRTVGFDIYATNDKNENLLGGACFVISKYGGIDKHE